ncbi:MAG TPA: hypothetical protein VFO03_09005, partial [Gaiellaceae bacterium]|nr:hypothetical protein [Gaiellaceae bacterium]
MRGTLIHVATGLLLGLALAGLLHAPSQVVAQEEARAPVARPKADAAGPWIQERTIRLSPTLERALEQKKHDRQQPARKLTPPTPAPPAEPTPAPVPPTQTVAEASQPAAPPARTPISEAPEPEADRTVKPTPTPAVPAPPPAPP